MRRSSCYADDIPDSANVDRALIRCRFSWITAVRPPTSIAKSFRSSLDVGHHPTRAPGGRGSPCRRRMMGGTSETLEAVGAGAAGRETDVVARLGAIGLTAGCLGAFMAASGWASRARSGLATIADIPQSNMGKVFAAFRRAHAQGRCVATASRAWSARGPPRLSRPAKTLCRRTGASQCGLSSNRSGFSRPGMLARALEASVASPVSASAAQAHPACIVIADAAEAASLQRTG